VTGELLALQRRDSRAQEILEAQPDFKLEMVYNAYMKRKRKSVRWSDQIVVDTAEYFNKNISK